MIIAFDIDSEAFEHDDNALNYTIQLMLDSLRCEELEVHGVRIDTKVLNTIVNTKEIKIIWDKESQNWQIKDLLEGE
jgi:hypothetical protein